MSTLFARKKVFYPLAGLAVALIVSIQAYLQAPKSYDGNRTYPRYNNYVIFKNSFDHLQTNQNLYVLYENEHWDLYKYSPTFAAMMIPFWYLSDLPGLFCWNLLNVLVLIYALSKVPFPSEKMKLLAHLFILPEVFTSMQNAQSNMLLAGLMILGFVYAQKGQLVKACAFVVLAAFVKPFALAVFVAFVFFPGKARMVLSAALVTLVLFLVPLLFVSWTDLITQYQNWYAMLQMDHSMSYGYSVLGWLNSWFLLEPPKLLVLLIGVVLLLLPLLRIKEYGNPRFQWFMLSALLLWVILFNHKSESPTFIIAVSGIAIWFFAMANRNRLDWVLLLFAFVFTCLIATDVFPRFIRKEWAEPYAWKVFPCLLIWLKISWDLFTVKSVKR